MSIRIVIVDDHASLRQSVCSLLRQESDMEVVAEAENGSEALDRVVALNPDVVLMDVRMPGMDGVEATAAIRYSHPEVKVIALSVHADPSFVKGMIDAGASGYVLKKLAFDELKMAVRAVVSDCWFMGNGLGGIAGVDANGELVYEGGHLTAP